MPTSKQQAVSAAEARAAKQYVEFCDRVETAIAAQTGAHVVVHVPTSGIESHVITRAMKTYEEVGWTCDLDFDQREGEVLKLS